MYCFIFAGHQNFVPILTFFLYLQNASLNSGEDQYKIGSIFSNLSSDSSIAKSNTQKEVFSEKTDGDQEDHLSVGCASDLNTSFISQKGKKSSSKQSWFQQDLSPTVNEDNLLSQTNQIIDGSISSKRIALSPELHSALSEKSVLSISQNSVSTVFEQGLAKPIQSPNISLKSKESSKRALSTISEGTMVEVDERDSDFKNKISSPNKSLEKVFVQEEKEEIETENVVQPINEKNEAEFVRNNDNISQDEVSLKSEEETLQSDSERAYNLAQEQERTRLISPKLVEEPAQAESAVVVETSKPLEAVEVVQENNKKKIYEEEEFLDMDVSKETMIQIRSVIRSALSKMDLSR